MAIASNPIRHVQTKHIEVDYHFICEKVLNKDITFNFISTYDQPTAIFTKGLTSSHFLLLRDMLMVYTPPIYLEVAVNLSHLSTRLQLIKVQLSFQNKTTPNMQKFMDIIP
jgi:hypothetical protein